MQSQEVRALGELAGEAVGGVVLRIKEMHQGIAGRVWDSVGVAGAPVKLIHDGVARAVYSTVRGALSTTTRAGAEALSLTRPPDAPSLERAPVGRAAIGALNGAFGDRLEERRSPLAIRMAVRRGGEAVEPTKPALRAAFPNATARLAVFLHGLCETEEAWLRGAPEHPPYGPRLRAELGYTPVYIRYNSGRHISDNGRELAELLARLTSAWPIEPHEIALIGHAMGGLVARSASYQGAGRTWVTTVRHVLMLGCPGTGAPLERAANAASAGLARLPETKALSTALNLRSAGVKDLRYGYLLEDDWQGYDPDAYGKRPATEVPFSPGADHYFISASIPGGGINHFQLLNHPAIYEQIRGWLSGRPTLPPAPLMLTAGSQEASAQRPLMLTAGSQEASAQRP